MTKRNSLTSITAMATLATIVLTAGSAFAGSNFDKNKDVAIPGTQLEFVHLNPAIQMADVYGDRATGMHGTFGKFPANFDAGFHTHSAAYHGVVIKGVMTNPFKDEKNPPIMQPGSYWYVPANSVHSTACVSDTPCEFYFYSDSKFDFFPVK